MGRMAWIWERRVGVGGRERESYADNDIVVNNCEKGQRV